MFACAIFLGMQYKKMLLVEDQGCFEILRVILLVMDLSYEKGLIKQDNIQVTRTRNYCDYFFFNV